MSELNFKLWSNLEPVSKVHLGMFWTSTFLDLDFNINPPSVNFSDDFYGRRKGHALSPVFGGGSLLCAQKFVSHQVSFYFTQYTEKSLAAVATLAQAASHGYSSFHG